MNRRNTERQYAVGRLPAVAPLANPYIPFQMEDSPQYAPDLALIRGTLYPGLDLPFKGMVNRKPLQDNPVTRLQVLAFAIQELALYLDTHPDDNEALMLYREYQKLYAHTEEAYRQQHGETTHFQEEHGPRYHWLEDPWPWEYHGNQEG